MSSAAQLQQLIEPAVRAVGLALWGVEFHVKGVHSLVRVYIDGPDGVTVDDCALASRQIGSVFDVEDPIAGEYTLEVSSPGLERPLYTLEQYRQFVGSRVKLRLRVPFDGRRGFTGTLGGVEDDEVLLVVGDDEYMFPFEDIDRAKIASEHGPAGQAHA